MKLDRIKAVADAVLYEGYILYPYRPSAIKNRQRWTFGCVFPYAFAGRQGDASSMRTQVLLHGGPRTEISVHLRFLQLVMRDVGSLPHPVGALSPDMRDDVTLVPGLELDGRKYLAWEEAIEREIPVVDMPLADIAATPRRAAFHFPELEAVEPVANAKGEIAALLIRSSCAIEGFVEIAAEEPLQGAYRVTVTVENTATLSAAETEDRRLAQRRAFASTHIVLGSRDGAFVSLMDPPAELGEAAATCKNTGTWPVLVGESGDTDAMLSSPIILYDYPQIAPQSAGDLYDATEIDEILTLRILAMTDEEKREMAAADVRARALLERTHGLTAAELAQMHGIMRPAGLPNSVRDADDALSAMTAAHDRPRLASPVGAGLDLTVGAQVRLRPRSGGDVMDLALAGQVAIIEAIERDFEDRLHIAVTLRDDPGRDLGAAGFPGHRFYFSQDEIEPFAAGDLP